MTNDEKLSRFVDQLDDEDELKNSYKRDKQEYKQLQLRDPKGFKIIRVEKIVIICGSKKWRS